MVILHRLNNQKFVLNADLVETIEATPDTLLTLTSGKKLMVKESVEEVVGKAIDYYRKCNAAIQVVQTQRDDLPEEEN